MVACCFRCTSRHAVGGWKRPNSGSSPPFELKWLAMTKNLAVAQPELRSQRLTARVPGRVRRIDPTRACGQLRTRSASIRLSSRVVESPPGRSTNCDAAVAAEEERDADVAAGLATVLIVDRVDLPPAVGRTAALTIGGRERIERDVRVRRRGRSSAPLLSCTSSSAIDVRALEVVDDQAGERVELRRPVGRVEVLDVERRDRDLLRRRRRRCLARRGRRRRRSSAVVRFSSKLPKLYSTMPTAGPLKWSPTFDVGVDPPRMSSSSWIRSGLKSVGRDDDPAARRADRAAGAVVGERPRSR